MECINPDCREELELEGEAIFCPLCGAPQVSTTAQPATPEITTHAAEKQDLAVLSNNVSVIDPVKLRIEEMIVKKIIAEPQTETIKVEEKGGFNQQGSHARAPHLLQPIVSETPESLRELVKNLRRIVNKYKQQVKSLTDERDDEKTRVKENLDKVQNEGIRSKKEAVARRTSAQSEIDKVSSYLKQMREQVSTHLIGQGVDVPASLQLNTPIRSEKASLGLAQAQSNATDAGRVMHEILKIKKPTKVIWPDENGFGVLALIVTGTVSIFLAQAADSPIVFLLLFGLLYSAFIAAWHVIPSSRMKNRYEVWRQFSENIEARLNAYEKQVETDFKASIETIEERYHRQANITYEKAVNAADAQYQTSLAKFKASFSHEVKEAQKRCAKFTQGTGFTGTPWNNHGWLNWVPASTPAFAACLGTISTGRVRMLPTFQDVNLNFTVPALVPLANNRTDLKEGTGRCLLIKTGGKEKEHAIKCVQSVMLRLLATIPPAKLRFTLIDPVGLGQNAASFMPLADFDESLIGGKAWTEPQHIEHQLTKLTEHMENVIQKYLRNEFQTIEDYNKKAMETAEPYRVLVIFDFPTNFNDTSARRLVSIAQNGPRCGVYTLVVMDTSPEKRLPYGFNVADLERSSTLISFRDGDFKWEDEDFNWCRLSLDEPPAADFFKRVINTVGAGAKLAMKVEVPYEKLLMKAELKEEERWSEKFSTRDLIQVPLGPRGAKDLQFLIFGEGTAHHAVVIGRTGSGKSNLMHVIITTLSLTYSPDEIRLYLIDFKQGVEFKPYAKASLPHAEVIAIESEREFGLSVLQGLDEELKKRGDLFRLHGVNNIKEYRKSVKELPRILLLVDEFQEFFVQEDNISRQATLILDRLVRQGRSAGIHVMLGSQTLVGASNLPHSIISQMGIRIALQCGEADSRQIMGDDNPVYRQLTRPGEAIYNASSGQIEGNNLFQVARFTDEDSDKYLKDLLKLAGQKDKQYAPIIFEGNEPSRIEDCRPLSTLLASTDWPENLKAASAWVGEPIAIRPPTAIRFRRQGGSHLLIVTRDEEEGVGMITSSILSLVAQYHPANAEFYIVNLSTTETAWSELPDEMADTLPHKVKTIGRRELPEVLKNLAAEINRRIEKPQIKGPELFLIFQGLHRVRDLRLEEGGSKYGLGFGKSEVKEPEPPELFANILREGPEAGVHVLAWCDAVINVKRMLDRKMLGEFGIRIAGSMSNEDSVNLIDDSAAARLDKPHRAIFFDEERPGFLEKFRPYAIPDTEWLKQAIRKLRMRVSQAQSA